MKQKRTIYSLLLTSFILVFAFSSLSAQTVSFGSLSVLRCQENTVDITVDAGVDISAFEIVFDVVSTSGGAGFSAVNVDWDPGLTVLTSHIVDLSGFDMITGTGTIRIAGMLIDNGDACLTAATVVGQVRFTTSNSCSGTIDLVGGSFACDNSSVTATTQFVACADNSIVEANVAVGTITMTNTAPTIEAITVDDISWGTVFTYVTDAADGDEATCETLSYSLTGPDGMTINANGVITWPTDGADVCTHAVEVTVSDACSASASTSFSVCVTNEAPILAVDISGDTVMSILAGMGGTLSGTVIGSDLDGGPSVLIYSLASFDGAGTVTVDPATGAWEWATMIDPAYSGEFHLFVSVTDGAEICEPCSPSNSAMVEFVITIVPFMTSIEGPTSASKGSTSTSGGAFQGQITNVNITTLNGNYVNYEIGGFDLLITYDASALSLIGIDKGLFLQECGWEYFTYRYGASGNCSGGCPSGVVRIVGIAETNDGYTDPNMCFTNSEGSNQLAQMNFLVTNDRTLECQYVPIRFIWHECSDNTFSDRTGNFLFVSRNIYDFGNSPDPLNQEIPADLTYPTYLGGFDCDGLDILAPFNPDDYNGENKPPVLRFVDFKNGGIQIACADSIDARGDINLNDIAYEIADAVLYSNYFVYGLSVFNINLEGQIAASDVNADGISLSVADLVYLIRVVVGDAQPYPKELAPVSATYSHTRNGVLSVSDVAVGGAYVVVEGNATPELLADNMEMKYNFDGVNTRILVYSFENKNFSGNFLNVNGNVVSIEMATYEGNPIVAKEIPTEFALRQNYPNPFNPRTIMVFDLPKASDVTLRIYNVKGQQVTSFDSYYEAGTVTIEWDASNLASGVYFYKLNAGNFSDTKKMVLLK